MDEYVSIYWAAACLVFWAGGGSNVTARQLNDAIGMICDEAALTPPQEGLLKTIVWRLMRKGAECSTK